MKRFIVLLFAALLVGGMVAVEVDSAERSIKSMFNYSREIRTECGTARFVKTGATAPDSATFTIPWTGGAAVRSVETVKYDISNLYLGTGPEALLDTLLVNNTITRTETRAETIAAYTDTLKQSALAALVGSNDYFGKVDSLVVHPQVTKATTVTWTETNAELPSGGYVALSASFTCSQAIDTLSVRVLAGMDEYNYEVLRSVAVYDPGVTGTATANATDAIIKLYSHELQGFKYLWFEVTHGDGSYAGPISVTPVTCFKEYVTIDDRASGVQ